MAAHRYVLGTDGRGWARPTAGRRRPPDPLGDAAVVAAIRPIEETKRCGGVDADPYNLQPWWSAENNRNGHDDVSVSSIFDNDTRPHSLVVPWRPLRSVLYSVRDAGCHRMLFNYCVRSVGQDRYDHSAVRHHVGQWLDAVVGPLVSPEAVAAGRWYPALWGASVIVRHLGEPPVNRTPGHPNDSHRRPIATPNDNFYEAVVLVSASIYWTVATLATFLYRR